MSIAPYLLAILGLAALMVVHEAGHYFAARRFGMRVTRFSIGFGPTIVKHKPKGPDTVLQIAIITFLAYVQIAGMNPFEESDPKDKGSYANASLLGRIITIAAGPAANYVFASLLMFIGFMLGGHTVVDEASMRVNPSPDGPAAQAGILSGDKVVSVNGTAIHDWDELKAAVGGHPGEAIDVEIERDGKSMHLKATPGADGDRKGKIMVGVSGGEMGIRGFVAAFDAANGEPVWKTYTIPVRANRATNRGRGIPGSAAANRFG